MFYGFLGNVLLWVVMICLDYYDYICDNYWDGKNLFYVNVLYLGISKLCVGLVEKFNNDVKCVVIN